VRETVIDGPFMPFDTLVTYTRMREPCLYCSPGTCSSGGMMASIVPRSTWIIFGFGPCWMTPATMSPSRPLNSPSTASSAMSRRR
jgi:hypothetical protein